MQDRIMLTEQAEDTAFFFAPFVSSPMRPEKAWFDYNGHLNMAYYHVLFDRAVDEAFERCGLGPDYAKTRGGSFFLVESRVSYKREVKTGDLLRMTLQLVDCDDKRLHYAMAMRHAKDGWVAATCENLSLHVNMLTRRAAPFPADIAANLQAMKATHAGLPQPEGLGLGVAMPRKHAVN
jgi:acyl-CoA thioester hydrolase